MALYYDITKVKTLWEQKSEDIATLLDSLFDFIVEIKTLVKDKDYKTSEVIIDHIIHLTDRLGIDFAHDEALLTKRWNESQGKRKEIEITLKSMVSHTKNAIKEIRKVKLNFLSELNHFLILEYFTCLFVRHIFQNISRLAI